MRPELPHLAGWRASRPVCVGNGAWDQGQLDVYGELLDAAQRLAEQLGERDPGHASVPGRRSGRGRQPVEREGSGNLGNPWRATGLPVLQAHVPGRARGRGRWRHVAMPQVRVTRPRPAPAAPAARRPHPKEAWRLWLAEFAGTALLVGVGLSAVIIDTSPSGPVAPLIGPGARLALTGFLFGAVGAGIAVSPVGKVSGAHINPIVTLAFVLRRRMRPWLAAGYVAAQLTGAVAGAAALLAWGPAGTEVHLGATVPGRAYGPALAAAGETGTSAALIVGLFIFIGSRRLRAWTPLLFPPLYALMVYLEAPVSGTSTNPARSLGPAVIAGIWHGWWVYWAGPVLGALIGVALIRPVRQLEVDIAKVYDFEHDRYGLLRWSGETDIRNGGDADDIRLDGDHAV
jgi:aquaporin Z